MKYLLWDIDGTLLLTGKAGLDALREAIRLRFHKENFTFARSVSGMTDSAIIKEIITEIKGRCSAGDAAGLLITYYQLLPQFLKTHQGGLLPGVLPLLQELQQRQDEFTCCLLTGNCGRSAYEKLKHYQIDQYFNYQLSAFGELSEERTLLAEAALQKISIQDPAVNPAEDIYILGDTPNDIRCADAIKAKSIIISGGSSYTPEELAAAHPWKLYASLPTDFSTFLTYLE